MRNQKGFALMEYLFVITLLAIVMPLIFGLMLYGIDCYTSYTKYTNEQYKVSRTMQLIRKDIEEASLVNLSGSELKVYKTLPVGSTPDAVWEMKDGKLYKSTASTSAIVAIDGLVTTGTAVTSSAFMMFPATVTSGGMQRLIVYVQPAAENVGKNTYRNISNPIITEFSVNYKNGN